MYILITIFAIIITILFVIGTHEAAHFMAARLVGIKVLRFSIGFGKKLFHFYDKKGTEYVLAAIPLGGYVKMLDENEEPVPANEKHMTYNNASFWKKCFVILAGPAMNIFCALLLYWIVFMVGYTTIKPIIGEIEPHSIAANAGMQPKQQIVTIDNDATDSWTSIIFRLVAHAGDQDVVNIGTQDMKTKLLRDYSLNLSKWEFDPLRPDLLSSLGITPYEPEIPLVIGLLSPNSPAANAKLQIGDKLIALDNKPIKDWLTLITTISASPEKVLNFKIKRKQQELTIPVTVGVKHTMLFIKRGYVGIGPNIVIPPEILQNIQYPFISAFTHAWIQVKDLSYFNLVMFAKMFTGKLSVKSLGGPITIFESAGTALNGGWIIFLSFLAFLSLSVGIINLFPIPGLDGGHILIHSIEAVIRRQLPEQVLILIFRVGLLFILFILVQALLNDILRLT